MFYGQFRCFYVIHIYTCLKSGYVYSVIDVALKQR